MPDILSFVSGLWAQHTRLVAGSMSLFVIAVTAFYLFWHERWLRRHLTDLQPDKRLAYLLHQWQLRNYQIIFALVLIATGVLSLPPFTGKESASKAPQASVTAPAQNPPADGVRLPPAAPGDPTAGPAAGPAAVPTADPGAVLDLFDNHTASPSELSLDTLKSRHENALVGAYILSNCNRASEEEVAVLLRAIRSDIMDYQADKTNQPVDAQLLYDNIVSAARGAYEIMYRRAACDDPQVDMLEQQFANYVMHYQAAEAR